MKGTTLGVLAVALILAVGLTGCATKTYVNEQVAAATKASDAKIGEVQKQVEVAQMDIANLKKSDEKQNQEIANISGTAKEALARAEEAGKLAKGKFLFEVTLTDEAVKFGFNSSSLSPEAKAALDAFAARVKAENKNIYIEVQGHTDSVGSEAYNLKLGQERADSVLRYLNMQHGIPLHRLNAVSYGEFKPVADNKTNSGRAQNRRVTLVVLE
ncbi:MAG: OmpA family protein [Thermoanaerobaculaceae bacterium]|nr:OmpA family protein [Thermoanaerobaculaceae bacterium]